MSRVKELGYLVLDVTSQDAWKEYLGGFFGLMPGEAGAGGDADVRFRIDDHAGRIILSLGESDDIAALGMEVEDAAALAALVDHLEALGFKTLASEDGLSGRRMVDDVVLVADPDGNRIELHHTPRRHPERPFISPRVSSAFLTEGQGVGHAVLATTNIEAMRRFYCDGLGFAVSDYIDVRLGPDMTAEATFLHCNARHHSIALLAAPFPKRLVHFMLEVEDVDDVGRLYSEAAGAGLQITSTLGRHTNDRMLSFYAATPSGFEIEFGCDGIAIEDGQWTPVRYSSTSVWGHERVKS